MGMFDNLLVNVECPKCKRSKIREVQTKDFDCLLEHFNVGDVVDGSIREIATYGVAECVNCDIYINVFCNIKDYKLTNEYTIESTQKR